MSNTAELFPGSETTQRGALISTDRVYRYWLSRSWSENPLRVLFVCVNPSTADAEKDDATIRRCTAYAKDWGYGGFYMVNLFAFRAREPDDMRAAALPIGPDNDRHILDIAEGCKTIVCGWGINGAHMGRDKEVAKMLIENGEDLHALHITKDGFPGHPLFLKKSLTPFLWKKRGEI